VNDYPDHIVNANDPLIPHDPKFFKQPNDDDAVRAIEAGIEARGRVRARTLSHEVLPKLDPAGLEKSGA
jgi:hypothetical protein